MHTKLNAMDSFNFHDIRVEKSNAIPGYQRIEQITILFRIIELLVFVIVVSRISFNQFVSSFKMLAEYTMGISVTLNSPQFVFLLGNAIVMVLFLKSGKLSAANGEKTTDLYEEYMEKCQVNQERKALDLDAYSCGNKLMKRSNSEKLERVDRRRALRRSVTDKYRRIPAATDEMSNEEFRRAVEAFIARQQRFLREE